MNSPFSYNGREGEREGDGEVIYRRESENKTSEIGMAEGEKKKQNWKRRKIERERAKKFKKNLEANTSVDK